MDKHLFADNPDGITQLGVRLTDKFRRTLERGPFFLTFLSETGFPNPKRSGERVSEFKNAIIASAKL